MVAAEDGNRPEPDFDRRVAEIRGRLPGADRKRYGAADQAGMAAGLRIAVELVAAIAVGTVMGLLLDGWLGTRPWLLVVFVLLGAAAGMLNVYRTGQELDRAAKARRAAASAGKSGKSTGRE